MPNYQSDRYGRTMEAPRYDRPMSSLYDILRAKIPPLEELGGPVETDPTVFGGKGGFDLSGFIEQLGKKIPQVPAVGLEAFTDSSRDVPFTPSSIPREPREVGLAGIMQQPTNESEGWTSVPETKSFMDPSRTGRYRAESGGPGAPLTQRYGGAASFMNDLEAASESRLRTADRLQAMPAPEAATRMYRETGVNKPYVSADEIFKQIVDLPTTESQARLAGPLAELNAITKEERDRRENAWLLQQFMGGKGPVAPEGISAAGLKTGQQLASAKRAEEGAGRDKRRLELAEDRADLARPGGRDIIARAQRMLGEKGHIAKLVDGTWFVFKGTSRTPIPNSEQAWAEVSKRAEAELRTGAP